MPRVACQRLSDDGKLSAIAFAAEIQTQGFEGQQLMYRVRVLDRKHRPIKSVNRRYEDRESNVAASKSLMVLQSPWSFNNIRVAIPANELEVTLADLPAWAEFAVYGPNGECLVRRFERLPMKAVADFPEYQAFAGTPDPESSPEDASPAEEPPQEQEQEDEEVSSDALARADTPEEPTSSDESSWSGIASSEDPLTDQKPTEKITEPKTGPEEAAPRETSQPDTQIAGDPSVAPPSSGRAVADERASSLRSYEREPAPTPPARQLDEPTTENRAGLTRVYRIEEGDTLESIARRHYGDAAYARYIFEANPDLDPNNLVTGWRIILPARPQTVTETPKREVREETSQPSETEPDPEPRTRTYTVQSGDTLTGIAKRALGDKNRWREILKLNRDQLTATNWLRVGMVLRLPEDAPGDSREGAGGASGSGTGGTTGKK